MEDAVRKKRYDEEEIKRLERLATAEKLKLKSIEDTAKRIADNEEKIKQKEHDALIKKQTDETNKIEEI